MLPFSYPMTLVILLKDKDQNPISEMGRKLTEFINAVDNEFLRINAGEGQVDLSQDLDF